MNEKTLRRLMPCDQCSMRRTRCNRQSPVCYSCNSSKLKCTWERQHKKKSINQSIKLLKNQSIFKHFSIADSQKVKKSGYRQNQSSIAKTTNAVSVPKSSATYTSPSWLSTMHKWQIDSVSRQDFCIIMKLWVFNLKQATWQDFRSISTIFSQQSKFVTKDEVFHYVDLHSREVLSLLALAEDKYFDHLNPTHFLFTRHAFSFRPRSLLLRLTVWRAGLQFTPASPFRDTLAYFIEVKIASLVCLSQTKPTLDTLQSYLVIGIGITVGCSSKLCNKWPYLNSFLSLVHQLGLHRTSPLPEDIQLERMLAYRVAFCWETQCAWSLGFKVFSLGIYYRLNPKVSRNAIESYTSRLFEGSIPNISKALDLCGLITSECLSRGSLSLLRLKRLFLRGNEKPLSDGLLLKAIDFALKDTHVTYRNAMKELRKIQLQCSCALGKEVYASAFTQALCLVAVNHHFTQVQLVELREKYAESTDSIISGLKSAVQAISIISSSPILILRVNPFTAIFHFIMKHYHAYHRVPIFFAAHRTMNPKELTEALLSAYTILKGKASYNLHCLYNNLSLTFFEHFVTKYNIGLPGDPTNSFK